MNLINPYELVIIQLMSYDHKINNNIQSIREEIASLKSIKRFHSISGSWFANEGKIKRSPSNHHFVDWELKRWLFGALNFISFVFLQTESQKSNKGQLGKVPLRSWMVTVDHEHTCESVLYPPFPLCARLNRGCRDTRARLISEQPEAELTETDSVRPERGIAFPFPGTTGGSICSTAQITCIQSFNAFQAALKLE